MTSWYVVLDARQIEGNDANGGRMLAMCLFCFVLALGHISTPEGWLFGREYL